MFSAHASNIVIPFDLDNENPLCLHHGFHLIFPTSFSPFYPDDKNLSFCIIYSGIPPSFSGLLHHVELLLPAIYPFRSIEDPFFASCSAHRELHFCFRRRINPSGNEEVIMLNKCAHLGRQAGRQHPMVEEWGAVRRKERSEGDDITWHNLHPPSSQSLSLESLS
jgi:hypothetical protein